MSPWFLCLCALAAGACDSPPARDTAVIGLARVAHYPAPREGADRVATPPRADAWIAEDKLRHFAMSFAATSFAYAGARSLLDPRPSLIVAGSATLLAGVGKEVHDVRAGQWFSLKDMAWDAAGVALGLTLAHHTR